MVREELRLEAGRGKYHMTHVEPSVGHVDPTDSDVFGQTLVFRLFSASRRSEATKKDFNKARCANSR